MQGGHWCRRKCDAPLSLYKTLPQLVNKIWNAHRIMKMQYQAYNGTNIPQLGALETAITWKDEETKEVNKMDTTFYIADTPGLVILGLPSCSRLRIVNLNCSAQLRKHGQPIKTCKEREIVKQNMRNLKPINSKDDLIKAYPDRFEGIGKSPGTYHIYLKEDAIPVVHTPQKCPITIKPLVDKKLDKLLEQEVIVPVTEPMDWVSSLAYSWKADDDLRTSLTPHIGTELSDRTTTGHQH